MLLASTAPTLMPPAPKIAAGADVALLDTSAKTLGAETASIVTSPSASTREFLMYATVNAGSWPPKAVLLWIVGSPISASSAAKNRFVAFQPIVLKASWIPTEVAPDIEALFVVASICERLSAVTTTSPPSAVVTKLSSTYAVASLSTRFVVMTPFAASDFPWPVIELPPDEEAVESAWARIKADSTASSPTAVVAENVGVLSAGALIPAALGAAFTIALKMYARVTLRTSFTTAIAPIADDGDCVMLNPVGRKLVSETGFQRPRSR